MGYRRCEWRRSMTPNRATKQIYFAGSMWILAHDSYSKGDLFGRLVTDVFLALGYEEPRLKVQKSGREVDVIARHRVEPKYAVAECKAEKKPVGGAALNKFYGVLHAEAEAHKPTAVQGYFISLSGYTEAAIEQEQGFERERFVLLDSVAVQKQLIAGGMVVPQVRAAEVAGRLASEANMSAKLAAPPVLLAHEIGWVWLVGLERDRELTHFALVHADGQPLAPNIAQSVILADSSVGGRLGGLEYLAPRQTVDRAAIEDADRRHRDYLLAELGDITLEGLPTDEDAGVRPIALADLYVPLKVERIAGNGVPDGGESGADDPRPESIGWVLGHSQRLAILAAPGAGKSTLISRLAIAYASANRSEQIADRLPDADWLPIFIRCRDLGKEQLGGSVREILDDTPRRGEFPECGEAFEELISEALRDGRILLLIDGLDEISDLGERTRFVRNLRTFLAIYPNVGLVLTSREPGFRAVGGALSSICDWYSLAEFDDDDIVSLTKAWHATVIGQSQQVADEAEKLAEMIIATDRVRRLAKNPLLLTTLLLVKRWVGDLPRKRTVLYEKAIEVLLMTWNVAAHKPIDREEAIPQLAFVAHALTEQGVQNVSSVGLAELLDKARKQMPEVLGFARTSVSGFAEQIESRSSLLVMTGHREEEGKLVPVYEFRHLTFQEYLAAVALVEGFYDGYDGSEQSADRLARYLVDPRWFEVVTLANVLAGRAVGAVIAGAVEVATVGGESAGEIKQARLILGRALADEVQVSPELAAKATLAFGRRENEVDPPHEEMVREIVEGRYGDAFGGWIEAAYRADQVAFFTDYTPDYELCVALGLTGESFGSEHLVAVRSALRDGDEEVAAAAAIEATAIASELSSRQSEDDQPAPRELEAWAGPLVELCETGRPFVAHAAIGALGGLGRLRAIEVEDRVLALRALLALWQNSWCRRTQDRAAAAITLMPPVERSLRPFEGVDLELPSFMERQGRFAHDAGSIGIRQLAALTLAYYAREPWSDGELRLQLESLVQVGSRQSLARRFPELAWIKSRP